MTVSELIEELRKYPADSDVHLLNCDEEPLCEAVKIDEVKLDEPDGVFICFGKGPIWISVSDGEKV